MFVQVFEMVIINNLNDIKKIKKVKLVISVVNIIIKKGWLKKHLEEIE